MVTGCGFRIGHRGAPAATPEPSYWQPAPDWVNERLSRIAPDVYFDLDQSAPGAGERESLVSAAPALKEILRDFPDLLIVLEGHCDDRGSREYNLQLGKRWADAVRQILVGTGFPSAHLQTVSLGSAQPRCFSQDEACRQRNRRVHFPSARTAGHEKR